MSCATFCRAYLISVFLFRFATSQSILFNVYLRKQTSVTDYQKGIRNNVIELRPAKSN